MEKIQIRHASLAAHLDYKASREPFVPVSDRQKQLISQWDRYVLDVIAPDPHAILIYYSAFTHPEPRTKFTEVNRAIQRDRDRIIQYSEALNRRLLVFPFDEMPPRETLLRQFERRGLTYIPEETELEAFGEYRRICVEILKTHTARELGIPEENSYVREDLSLEHYQPTYSQTHQIDPTEVAEIAHAVIFS